MAHAWARLVSHDAIGLNMITHIVVILRLTFLIAQDIRYAGLLGQNSCM